MHQSIILTLHRGLPLKMPKASDTKHSSRRILATNNMALSLKTPSLALVSIGGVLLEGEYQIKKVNPQSSPYPKD